MTLLAKLMGPRGDRTQADRGACGGKEPEGAASPLKALPSVHCHCVYEGGKGTVSFFHGLSSDCVA